MRYNECVTHYRLELELGAITLKEYIERCRDCQPTRSGFKLIMRYEPVPEIDRLRGMTPKMHAYCRNVGIDDVPDLKTRWKLQRDPRYYPNGRRHQNV